MKYNKVLKSVVVTEKATGINEKENKYTFKVVHDATKGQIKDAVEKLYSVKVLGVNVLKTRSKAKRSMVSRKDIYYTPTSKKAVVELKSGDKLKFYDGGSK